ncbi:hypothetical protein P692DRAFT_20713837, partial [Suillus brevipes Sb2]
VADSRANPTWTSMLSFVCVGFMSASIGLQGIMGKRINTQFIKVCFRCLFIVFLTFTSMQLNLSKRAFLKIRSIISCLSQDLSQSPQPHPHVATPSLTATS